MPWSRPRSLRQFRLFEALPGVSKLRHRAVSSRTIELPPAEIAHLRQRQRIEHRFLSFLCGLYCSVSVEDAASCVLVAHNFCRFGTGVANGLGVNQLVQPGPTDHPIQGEPTNEDFLDRWRTARTHHDWRGAHKRQPGKLARAAGRLADANAEVLLSRRGWRTQSSLRKAGVFPEGRLSRDGRTSVPRMFR